MPQRIKLGFLLSQLVLVSSCAFDITDVKYVPATIMERTNQNAFVFDDDLRVTQTPCWYTRTLRKGTRWESVGTIAQGDVFRSKDQSLTVECSNVFEAYLVVREERLVGFYLPVERGFVSIADPMSLPRSPNRP